MLLTGRDLFTTRHIGSSTASVSEVRLATRSGGKFFASTGATFKAAAEPSSSVVPSGSARATVTAAKVPPPPGRWSRVTGSLVATENASPTAWPIASTAPPGASGLTILIGRVGQSCAHTPDAPISSSAATPRPLAALQIRLMRLPRLASLGFPSGQHTEFAGSSPEAWFQTDKRSIGAQSHDWTSASD